MTDARPATPLQAARLALGWSQTRLIYELEQAAAAAGVTVQSRASLKVSVSKWENGRTGVSPVYQRLFRSIYKMTDAELGFSVPGAAAGIVFPPAWTEGVAQAGALWQSDASGLETDSDFAATDFATPALRWLIGERDEPYREGGILVGRPHVQAIRQMTVSMRAVDNEYGGGYARASVVRYLHHKVTPLLQDGRYDTRLGAELFSAAAEMTQLAGWMTYDAGQYGLAQRYLTDALRLAMAAGDRPLGGEILAAMSHQCTYLGHGGTGVDLARVAGRTARRAGVTALVAETAVLEAHGHANQGDERACTVALGQAEHVLDRADRSADPAFISYFDEAYVAAKFGHCFRELGKPRQATRFARRSLQMDGHYVRGKMFNLALLATAHAQTGDIEDACHIGGQALGIAVQLQSARAIGYINRLRRELSTHARAPVVRAFEIRAAAAIS